MRNKLIVLGFMLILGAQASAQPAELSAPADAGQAGLSFEAGTVDLDFIGGAYTESFGGNDETLAFGGLHLDLFPCDRIAFTVETLGYSVDQIDPDATAFGFSLGARWYLWQPSEKVGVFIEGGVGMVQSDFRLPTTEGTHFNFTALGGLGVKAQLNDHLSLVCGARYFHLSNANMQGDERNPSIDAFGGFGGLTISF